MGLLNQTAQAYYDGDDYGNYQFVSLTDIINQFMLIYVGEDKIIPKAKRLDVAFHAQRALAELSFDTFKSCKAQEITVPSTLQMTLPHDYVNYTKISWVDSAGIKHLMYPTSKTSNPSSNPLQDDNGDFTLQAVGRIYTSSNEIILTSEHKDILVGMRVVQNPYLPNDTFVSGTSNVGGLTTITLDDGNGVNVFPSQDADGIVLAFENKDGSLILPQKSSFIVENLYWNIADYKIINNVGASELTDIKVGMIVSHDNFPIGTVVTNVFGNTIVVDQLPDTPVIPANAQDITFVSPDLKDTDTWSSYKSATPSENQDDY